MQTKDIRFKVFDGELMHDVSELHFCAGGIKWFGHGVGEGWCSVVKEIFIRNKEAVPKIDNLIRNTGLCDSNDKEIWEDDIVKVKYQPRLGNIGTFYGTVFEDDGLWMIDFQNHGTAIHIGAGGESEFESVEVIGNIWENKDMFNIEKMELLIK